ncbi:peptidase S41 [Parahaliea aestuarii]|uniref:Peptidase S41 n=2 Tax=Parahaliea aestuarii TaxID=1852021 RepID=A0A5C8ZYF1_9GAMM|nr:carboxy terminal-processing peptidase [Parahaliea aestuarii]TXS93605.1 peptidase S41 [Parahaliea aestuarii]
MLLLASTAPALALIEYTDTQRETMVDMIDQLEERHYAKLRYDDELSSQHLDNYIDSLDSGRMFFTASDLAEFESYRMQMDDDLHKGRLDAGFNIFNRFQQRLVERLESVVDTLPEAIAAMDFSVEEDYLLDAEDRPWATDQAELDDRWRRHLKNQVLSLRMSEKPQDEIAETLSKRYKNQLKRVQQYNSQDVFQIYANALTELYDPHTNYLSPRRSENFNINMSLSLEGIGAVLQLEDEYTKVVRLVPAGPADKQGELKPSDRIVGVAQGDDEEFEDVIGWRLDEVVELIRGPKGSTVRLQVMPGKAAKTGERKVVTIVRNKVKLEEQAAQKKVLEIPNGDKMMKVGVIDIPAFYIDFDAMRRGEKDYKSTTRDVKVLLDELQNEDQVDGVVIDLRNNGGGSLQEANELTGLFIEYGPTVQIRHSSRRVWRDGKRLRGPYYDGPLVVLINRLSASASEIFAGAIQDYQRGLIVGDRSFGKGTVQTLIPLPEGQLKLTESKFYRISGDSTQHRGVVPDVTFPALYDHEEIGESALDHALNWDKINPVRHRRYQDINDLLPEVTRLFQERSGNNPEYIFLEDQVDLAEESREIKYLPLNEEARRALADEQDSKALAIENKRRAALGEELLTSLDEDQEVTDAEDVADGDEAENDDSTGEGESLASEEEEVPDVLLTEAGNILVDTLLLREQRFAAHTPGGEKAVTE